MGNQTIDGASADSANSNMSEASSSKASHYLVLLVAILLVSGGLIFYFYKTLDQIEINSVIEDIAQTPPSGTIILTATLDGIPSVFTLDLETEDALFYKFPSDYEITAFPEFTDKINSAKVFFVGSTPESEGEVDKLGLSSWIAGMEGVEYYQSAAGNVERDLNWSEDAGRLAYFRIKDSVEIVTEGNRSIDDYEIVIIDPAQDVVTAVIDGGIYPRWSPTGETLLFLKKDGIYEFNLVAKTETKIKGPDQSDVTLTTAEMLDVSPDKSKLIITSQGPGLITMFDVTSWNPLTIEANYTYEDTDVRYSSPQFSPDSTKYALLTLDIVEDTFVPILEIRDSKTAEVLFSRQVGAFDITQFYISDWIADTVSGNTIISDNPTSTNN